MSRPNVSLSRKLTLALLLIVCTAAATWMLRNANTDAPMRWIVFAHQHTALIALICALQATNSVVRRKRRLVLEFSQSWIAATPRASLTLGSAILLGSLFSAAWQLLGISFCLGLIMAAGGVNAPAAGHLLITAAISFAIGACTGWFLPNKRPSAVTPGSRYVPRRAVELFPLRQTQNRTLDASLAGLSRWPVAQAFAWATPQTLRWPLMAALLSVMAGSSGLTGLLVVSFWATVYYMVSLLNATLTVAREAGGWLRTTPIRFSTFAISIAKRSLLHQCAAVVAICGFLTAAQMGLTTIALFASVWVALVIMVYSTGISNSFRLNNRRTATCIAAGALSIALVESLHRGLAIPISILIAVFQLRQAARPMLDNGVSP